MMMAHHATDATRSFGTRVNHEQQACLKMSLVSLSLCQYYLYLQRLALTCSVHNQLLLSYPGNIQDKTHIP
jgi:hypothetical protein